MERISRAIQPQAPIGGRKPEVGQKNSSPGSFQAVLQATAQQAQQAQRGQGVEFSKHAMTRAAERGIDITPQLMDQLQGGMERAQEKGATNILAMDAEMAFIINVPRARVITAITQDEMKENIFTNIDGAVFL